MCIRDRLDPSCSDFPNALFSSPHFKLNFRIALCKLKSHRVVFVNFNYGVYVGLSNFPSYFHWTVVVPTIIKMKSHFVIVSHVVSFYQKLIEGMYPVDLK